MTDYECGIEQASNIYKEVIREYVAENTKLRELVHGLYWCNDKKWNKGACDDCPIRGGAVGRCERAMRELGIEVES